MSAFFFQAEDGIRGADVTGVQTCALPISDTGHLPVGEIVTRAALFFGYLIGFMAIMAVIGLIPTVGVFVVFFMRYEAREQIGRAHV